MFKESAGAGPELFLQSGKEKCGLWFDLSQIVGISPLRFSGIGCTMRFLFAAHGAAEKVL